VTKIVPESNREKPEKIITKVRKVENTKKNVGEKALRK
jgi:hypothetical protein